MQPKTLAIQLARQAGKMLRDNYGKVKSLKLKGGNWQDIVTNVDIEANKLIVKAIQRAFPDHNIIAEESKQPEKGSDYTWYIDPLDGTTNYAIQIPFFCVGIGLAFKNQPVLGVVYNPITGELFVGEKGKCSTLNGRLIHTSNNRELKATVVNYCHPNTPDGIKEISRLFLKFKLNARDFRRFGSAGLDFCYLACGRNDVYVHCNSKETPWDFVPGYVIAKGTGARITDWENRPWTLESENLLATNGKLHNRVLRMLKK